jgi:hypothetical protein
MNATEEYAAKNEALSQTLSQALASPFPAMGVLCCVQMFIMIAITFKRRSGLYFWSLIGATSAQFICSFSTLLQQSILIGRLLALSNSLNITGYLLYPPFEFLVLYSRIHLLQASNRVLRFVLIIFTLEWTLFEIPMAFCGFLAQRYPDSTKIAFAYKVTWEIEEAAFPMVTFMMYGLYILQVKRMWGDSGDRIKWILWHVIMMTVVLILIDASYIILANTVVVGWAVAIEVRS